MPALSGTKLLRFVAEDTSHDTYYEIAADTIRILVATDSHVGYEERDPIRKDDSWKSFDEVLTLAKTQDVRPMRHIL